ncbi:ABC transporter permease [Sinimarinibacterium sp. CAU 1509]|uniref:ABC transporter permease n=1 Tax=Sinimarinibacterium sp. CAU 1509 TaxID=2562283 RepID=UPI0010ACC3F2|nr:ABC transporter permease [Sinimarinibacterium sp. CAU 1509]TJY62127.1 ABC transporter permease [Sinimarinibacterium sp. CAU 1509]
MIGRFSFARLGAMVRKEFIQVRRDRLTFAMMIGIPVVQLALFGFAINSDPKHLPTAVVVEDHSAFSRSLLASMQASDYFDLVETHARIDAAQGMLRDGDVQFLLTIPTDFARTLVRGERPALLLEADASDPAATSNALAVLDPLVRSAMTAELRGPLASLATASAPFEWNVHRLYNPEGITQYNIVPGLMGVILTMTMIIMTALGVTREIERGTMENLLAMPVRPLEVLIGKILPYVLVGYVQVLVILLASHYVFAVPIVGSLAWLVICVLVFIVANLTVGITFSSIARNQTQAMQMGFFFFLPTILLSGFMFPFRGMPHWAQMLGEILPLTHFLRLVRGIMLKGYGVAESWPNLWPLMVFTAVVLAIGLKRYRQTLD